MNKELENAVPKIIYFIPDGRSGNNIFQYLAAEVIKHIFNFDIVQKINRVPQNALVINDELYKNITEKYLENKEKIIYETKNIVLVGYFQRSDILLYLRDYLLKKFNKSNNTYINNTYKISDFSSDETKHKISLDENDLVLHLRLDDFIHHNNPPNIFDKVEFCKYLDTIKFTKLYIVCDEIHHQWEKDYLDYFINKYKAIILSGSLFDDFNFLKNCNRLVISNSTFSWIAAYLGNAKEVYIPYSDFYKTHQSLKECHRNCKIHYDIPFAKF